MEDKLKRKILKYIERNDPSHKIVTIDEVNKKIIYSDKIVCHNPIKFENEGYVRAYLVVKLIIEMKYPIECIELEKHYNIGSKPKDKNAFIDIIVRDKKHLKMFSCLLNVKHLKHMKVIKQRLKLSYLIWQLFRIKKEK